MAGAASTNAVLFTLAVLLMLAWKVAGWYGLDRFLLPLIGTPWTWVSAEPPQLPEARQVGSLG
jgi:thiosulfate dehydrogenase (quinone) large subunit